MRERKISTWGFDDGRLVYLAKFNVPFPADGICECGFVSKDEKAWEAHATTHRSWHYASAELPLDGSKISDADLRYSKGLSQHRLCSCQEPSQSLWCPACGGYVSIDKLESKPWLRANRRSRTDSGIPLIWD